MAEYLIQDNSLIAIGNAIRFKTGKTDTFSPAQMANEILNIKSLNFSIIGSITQPSNPTENMIWINSDQAITSYIFDFIEPSNPIEGMLWITIGTSSNIKFNALTENSIIINPYSAKQYINNNWITKSAMSYINNTWISWSDYLYYYNKQTYSWSAVAMSEAIAGNQQGVAPGIVINSNGSVTITGRNGSKTYVGGIYKLSSSFDFTDVKALVFDIASGGANGTIFTAGGDAWGGNTSYGGDQKRGIELSPGIHTLDTSDLYGKYDFGIGVMAGSVITLNSIEIIK